MTPYPVCFIYSRMAMEEITSEIPCRDKQISLLTDLFGNVRFIKYDFLGWELFGSSVGSNCLPCM